MAHLHPMNSLIEGAAQDTGWVLVAGAAVGSGVNGTAGALGETLAYTGGKHTVSGTPAAVIADGANECRRYPVGLPFTLAFGDILLARWQGITVSAASSWYIAIGLTGSTPATDDALGGGFFGTTSKGGIAINGGGDNATAESASMSAVRVLMSTVATNRLETCVVSPMSSALEVLSEPKGRGVGATTLSALACYLYVGTIDASQNTGTLAGSLEVRRLRTVA